MHLHRTGNSSNVIHPFFDLEPYRKLGFVFWDNETANYRPQFADEDNVTFALGSVAVRCCVRKTMQLLATVVLTLLCGTHPQSWSLYVLIPYYAHCEDPATFSFMSAFLSVQTNSQTFRKHFNLPECSQYALENGLFCGCI